APTGPVRSRRPCGRERLYPRRTSSGSPLGADDNTRPQRAHAAAALRERLRLWTKDPGAHPALPAIPRPPSPFGSAGIGRTGGRERLRRSGASDARGPAFGRPDAGQLHGPVRRLSGRIVQDVRRALRHNRGMKRLDPAQIDAAERFVWLSGRLLERLRFAFLFRGGSRERVLAALRPYQNDDGGFGEALEPDFRGPVSQPTTADQALRLLDEMDAFDDPMVRRVCDHLTTVGMTDGGVPIMLADVPRYPHAPWWEPGPGAPRASLLPTGGIAGLLHKHRIEHPWLAPATNFCWAAIDDLMDAPLSLGLPYVIRFALAFLDHVPDRRRAEQAAAALGQHALRIKAVT